MANQIQSLIFNKEKFKNKLTAISWAIKRKFKTRKVDEKRKTFRIRQIDPSKFIKNSFRTIKLTKNVSAIIGRRKKTLKKLKSKR